MMTTGKTLIVGASGYVGRNLFDLIGPEAGAGTYNQSAMPGGLKFDTGTMQLADLDFNLSEYSQAILLNGETSPDACANDIERSESINVTQIISLIDELYDHDIRPVFISTEAVFDGRKGNYVEQDEPNPILAYGRQKVEVEQYLLAKGRPFQIIRLSKIYDSSLQAGSFLGNWYSQITAGGNDIRCAEDFISCPVHVDDVCRAIRALVALDETGIFHVAGPQALSRYGICQILADEIKRLQPMDVCIRPCSIHDFPTVEPRPLNISLNAEKTILRTALNFRDVRSVCREMVQNLSSSLQ
jgi:dTDP-4-dehydrorhamnose reductase